MDSERFQAIRGIFEAALEKDAASRDQFIRESCGGDESLQKEVDSLLTAHNSANSWIDSERDGSIIRPTSVTFKPGTKLGTYEIVGLLGVGGMGEVYRARDTTLTSRQVALKVLPEAFARDPERVSRFEREALVLASLNHPHIGAIYHVVESETSRLLVLELVEGETLADRITQGPIPVAETLTIAKQIAEALESAHDKGIVHRDLKPANIKITPDDQVKVLDFGIAKVRDRDGANIEAYPTLNTTVPSRILGTAAYMSPEQASGKEADPRSDIWAFGCLLFEMLSGSALFTGESVSEILAEVLKAEPDLSRLPTSTPPGIRRLLRRCLQKDRKRRLRHIGDARIEIEEAFTEPEPGILTTPSRMTRREALAWMSAGGLALATATSGLWWKRPHDIDITVIPHDGQVFTGPHTATVPIPQFALSPDGGRIVYAAAKTKDKPVLWVRSVARVNPIALPGTKGAEGPFWSPDGTWIGFFSDEGKLMKVRSDGSSLAIAIISEEVADPRGGSWGSQKTILYASGISEIYQIGENGGTATKVTELSAQEGSHRWPCFLPDGKHFLYTVRSIDPERRGIWFANVENRSDSKRLIAEVDSNALYSGTGHLLYLDEDQLKARSFDQALLDFSDKEAKSIVERDVGRSTLGSGAISVSKNGVLAWAGPMLNLGHLQWFDRQNVPIGEPLNEEPNDHTDFRLSHNGQWLAATRTQPKTGRVDIWRSELHRGGWETFIGGRGSINANPVFSRDDKKILFRSNPKGVIELYEMPFPEIGQKQEPILDEDTLRKIGFEFTSLALTDWVNNTVLFSVPTKKSRFDLWHVQLEKDGARSKPTFFIEEKSDQIHGNFSWDGKFVAYSSNQDSDRYEVYVDTVPPSSRQSVSLGVNAAPGGSEPRWREDGRELYYLSEDRSLMRVSFENGMRGDAQVLFRTRAPGGVNALRSNYVPAPNGQRFLINTQSPDPAVPSITVFTNWQAHMK